MVYMVSPHLPTAQRKLAAFALAETLRYYVVTTSMAAAAVLIAFLTGVEGAARAVIVTLSWVVVIAVVVTGRKLRTSAQVATSAQMLEARDGMVAYTGHYPPECWWVENSVKLIENLEDCLRQESPALRRALWGLYQEILSSAESNDPERGQEAYNAFCKDVDKIIVDTLNIAAATLNLAREFGAPYLDGANWDAAVEMLCTSTEATEDDLRVLRYTMFAWEPSRRYILQGQWY